MKRVWIMGVLLITLLLPSSIFLFLKVFGRNEFQVPVLSWSERPLPEGCADRYDSLFFLQQVDRPQLVLLTGPGPVRDRLQEEMPESVALIEPGAEQDREAWRCAWRMQPSEEAVLLDARLQVRGYYQVKKREEADRLIMEAKILLKQY